ncbi:MAG: PKD domain-containing protein [Candidatus Auribacterota bacterium]
MRFVFLIIISLCCLIVSLYAQDADHYWGQWHGPANGRACVPEAPGPDLRLAWSLNLFDPYDNDSLIGNFGYHVTNIYNEGTLVRADGSYIYLKVNRDYTGAADPTVWKIDPVTGARLTSYPKASGEDTWVSRAFQLYDSPDGAVSLHAACFYGTNWDTVNLDNDSTAKYLGDSHSCLGSRVLMGKWAWRNNRFRSPHSIAYYHGGELQWWNGTGYAVRVEEDFSLIDHAWDDSKCVIFALTGYAGGVPYEKARYWVLDNEGSVTMDVEISDIYRPAGSTYWRPSNTDIVMKLAVKGDYIYAIERRTSVETNLVRRQISAGFVNSGEIALGTVYANRSLSYCIDDNAVYVQWPAKISAYSLDLSAVLWEQETPLRTVRHSDIQGFDYYRWPGTRNYSCQTIACNGQYIYSTADDRFQVHRASDGALVYQYILTDVPHRASHETKYRVIGEPGDIILMPDCVVVVSQLNCTRIWAFRPDSEAAQAPELIDPSNDTVVAYEGETLEYQIQLAKGAGPYTWSIDPATDDSVEPFLTVTDSGEITGWTPAPQDSCHTYGIVASVSNVTGSDSVWLNVTVLESPVTLTLCDFTDNNRIEAPGFSEAYYDAYYAGPHHVVKGTGRYFRAGEQLIFHFRNDSDATISGQYPQISFTHEDRMSQYSSDTVKMQYIPVGSVYISPHSTTTKSFTLNKVDEGFHTMVNVWHTGLTLDKIELRGAFFIPVPDPGDDYYTVPGYTVVMDGSGSSNPQGTPLEFEWDFGDLTDFGVAETVEHAYASTGEYTVSLRVRNAGDNWSVSRSVIVYVLDNDGDYDCDGILNSEELAYGTALNNNDTDYDGMFDKWEIDNNLDPLESGDASLDNDNDGVSNNVEHAFGSNPHSVDTDNDGQTDYQEIVAGMDPADPSSFFAMCGCEITPVQDGVAATITWTSAEPGQEYGWYTIYWKHPADEQWTEVGSRAYNEASTHNGDGTQSWTDTSITQDTETRIYKVAAQSYLDLDSGDGTLLKKN